MRFDLHIHSHHSHDSLMDEATIVNEALRKGLDGIAVCDHNRFVGTEALEQQANGRLTVIPAAEYATDAGHMLIFFLKEDCRPYTEVNEKGLLRLESLKKEAQRQGALLFAAHPLKRRKALPEGLTEAVCGLEVCNSRAMSLRASDASRLSRHCRQHGLSRCGGSDAHIPQEIGRCWTEVEGDVYRALAEGRTRVFGRAGWRLHSAESHRRCPANKTVRLTLPLRYVKNACQDLWRLASRLKGAKEY